MRIAVIGSGSWGCALCAVLAEKGHDVCLWSYFPEESKMLEKDRENKKNLPQTVEEVIIDGGCHAYFGMYGAQEGDGEPQITNEEQIAYTVDTIMAFVN